MLSEGKGRVVVKAANEKVLYMFVYVYMYIWLRGLGARGPPVTQGELGPWGRGTYGYGVSFMGGARARKKLRSLSIHENMVQGVLSRPRDPQGITADTSDASHSRHVCCVTLQSHPPQVFVSAFHEQSKYHNQHSCFIVRFLCFSSCSFVLKGGRTLPP